MRILGLSICLLLGGCLTVQVSGEDLGQAGGADLAQSDLAHQGNSTDMANHMSDLASTDLTSAGGTKLFGDGCTLDGDCMSAMCRQFQGGAVHKCTKPCVFVSQTAVAPECPNPPSTGLCTNNAYCKF